MTKLEENIYYDGDFPQSITTKQLSFKLIIRVSPVVGGRQVQRKKSFKFRDISVKNAIKSIRDVPEKMKKALQSGSVIRDAVILNEVWKEFYHYKTQSKTAKLWRHQTAKTTYSLYNKWIKDSYLGTMRVNEIKRKHIYSFIEDIAESGNKSTPHAAKVLLTNIFTWWINKEELERTNPAKIEVHKQEANRHEIVEKTIAERQYIFKAMLANPKYQIVQVFKFLMQGRRINEAITLSTSDVSEGYYTITAEKNKAKVTMKYKLPYDIDIANGDWMCPSSAHPTTHISSQAVRQAWNKMFPDLHLHDIRHLIGQTLVQAEVPLEFIGMMLGHSNKSNITYRYTGGSPDTAFKVYELFYDIVINNKIDRKWNDI